MKKRLFIYIKNQNMDQWVEAFQAVDPDLEIFCYPHWPDESNTCSAFPTEGPYPEITPDNDSQDYAFVWQPPAGLLSCFRGLKAIFSLGAGVEHLATDPFLPNIPVIRMADQGLRDSMAEYILMGTLMLHRQMPVMLQQQNRKNFNQISIAEAKDITIGLMGYGNLSKAAAQVPQ